MVKPGNQQSQQRAAQGISQKRFTERTHSPFAGARVDRTTGVIHDVLICGFTSANGRDYPAAVFKRDFARYEGRPVNCDHGRESTVDRRFGWFTNVRPGSDGRPRGTLNCLKSHPMYERVMEAAERNPALFGFSHVAICRTRPGTGGREVVEAIDEVESIDLVAEPATTKSLFEGRTNVKTTLGKVIEKYRTQLKEAKLQKAARRLLLLAEDDAGMGTMMDTPVDEPAADTSPEDGIKGAFLQACVHLCQQCFDGDLDLKECLSKLKELLTSHMKVNGKDGASAGTATGAEGEPATGEEAKKRKGGDAILEALDACATAGFTSPCREDLELVAAATAERRPALIERLKKSAAQQTTTVESTGKSRIDPSLTADPKAKQKNQEDKPPSDPQEFARYLA